MTKGEAHSVKMYNNKKATTTTNKTVMTTIKTHRKRRNVRETQQNRLWKTLGNTDFTINSSPSSLSSASSTTTTLCTPISSSRTFLEMKLTETNNHKRPTTTTTAQTRHRAIYSSLHPLTILLLMLVQLINVSTHSSAFDLNGHLTTTMKTTTEATAATTPATLHILAQRTTNNKFSQPLKEEDNDEYNFRPIIPKDINLEYISQNVFTKAGQYRVFEPIESDLRANVALRKFTDDEVVKASTTTTKAPTVSKATTPKSLQSFEYQSALKTKTNNATTTQNVGVPKSKQISSSGIISTKTTQSPPIPSPTSTTGFVNTSTLNENSMSFVAASEIEKGLESLLAEYVDNFFNKGQYQPKPELIMALQQNYTTMKRSYDEKIEAHLPKVASPTPPPPKNSKHLRPARQAFTKRSNGELSLNIPRALESGRLLFFAGLKKVMWPIYMGLQILKSLMFALLLPTLIGSFGKLLGKGITSGSAPLFIRPPDEPQDLDFKDNNFNFDDDSNKFSLMDDTTKDAGGGYAYNQAEASQTQNQYAYNAASINQQALSRYSLNERQQLMQDSYLSALQSLGAASFKNSNGLLGSSSSGGNGLSAAAAAGAPLRQKPEAPANMNTFQQFQKVPASSLLLSNYDPFYSPLLSRLDSVFAQLKLNSDDETCREKLICLMYANPAKYAPYSNLVSAQLSRELNELRKPTSDNPDILRFFKYMRAAKDGQDGIDCEKSFEKCKEFKDFENPAMLSTYHDINKLVQARKMT